MTNVVATDHEDDFLGDVGGVVSDALQMFRHPHHAKSSRHVVRMLGDVVAHLRNDGAAMLVYGAPCSMSWTSSVMDASSF
jgi:hypothetical protein